MEQKDGLFSIQIFEGMLQIWPSFYFFSENCA